MPSPERPDKGEENKGNKGLKSPSERFKALAGRILSVARSELKDEEEKYAARKEEGEEQSDS